MNDREPSLAHLVFWRSYVTFFSLHRATFIFTKWWFDSIIWSDVCERISYRIHSICHMPISIAHTQSSLRKNEGYFQSTISEILSPIETFSVIMWRLKFHLYTDLKNTFVEPSISRNIIDWNHHSFSRRLLCLCVRAIAVGTLNAHYQVCPMLYQLTQILNTKRRNSQRNFRWFLTIHSLIWLTPLLRKHELTSYQCLISFWAHFAQRKMFFFFFWTIE